MDFRRLTAACIVAFFLTAPSSAALILSIGSTSIPQGGTGFVDVTISSSDGSDVMSSFNLDLLITGPGGVSFTVPQPDPYSQAAYVFSSNSANDPAPFFGLGPSLTNYPDDTVSGGDSTLDTFNETIATTPVTELLARLYLTVAPAAPLGPSTIDLGSSSVFQYDSGGMGYADMDISWDPISPGIITVTDAGAAVPEPSSLALMAGLGVAFAWGRRVSRRSAKSKTKDAALA